MAVPAGFVGNSNGTYTRASDGAGPFSHDGTSMIFSGVLPAAAISSGNVANAIASATVGPVSGRTSFLTGFQVTGAGATVGSVVLVTVTGVLGGTMTYPLAVPTGATAGLTPLIINFPNPLASTTTNTAITVSVPAFGAGNTNAAVVVHGYVF